MEKRIFRSCYLSQLANIFLMFMLLTVPAMAYGIESDPTEVHFEMPLDLENYTPPAEASIDRDNEGIRSIISQLNSLFDGQWSFKILYHKFLDDAVVVMGEVTAGSEVKQQFGASPFKKSDSEDVGNHPFSRGEALEAATTEAFRKAAALFGVGPQHSTGSIATNGHEVSSPEPMKITKIDIPASVDIPLARATSTVDAWFDSGETPYVGTPTEPEIINTRSINYDDYLLEAVRITSPPEMNGFLDDAVWRRAPAAAGFRQLWPSEGYLDTERTEVRVLYDEHTIYFGIMCYDQEPDKIVATEMRRDQNVDADDNFEMTIAPYGDQGDSYYFITNPLGSRRDALIGTGFSSFSPDWNATWQCYGKRHAMGWSLEIAIPFRNFRFDPEGKQDWAVNFGRHVKRTRGAAFWVPISRAEGGLASFYKYTKGGRVVGLENINPGRSVEVLPYSVLGTLGDRTISGGAENLAYNFKRDFGGDIKWAITSGITADATINPDFAQVSADDQIVNLTRFEFGFQEKRPFFLEGVGIFSFGGFFTQPNIFFSRRIGSQLFDGSNVRILHGEKVSGKIGRTNFGILNVQTEETPWAFTSAQVQTLTDTTTLTDGSFRFTDRDTLTVNRFPQIESETSWHVFRLKRNLFARSSIGLMATLKEPEDRPNNKIEWPGFRLSKADYNRVIGMDAQIQFARSQHQMGLILAKSFVPGNKLDSQVLAVGDSTLLNQSALDWAGTISHGWGNSWFNMNSSYTDIRAGFTADMGFIPRRDIRQGSASMGVTRLLRKWGIRSIGSRGSGGGFGAGLLSGTWITRHQGNFFDPGLVESWDFGVNPGMEFENGTRIGAGWTRAFDRLSQPTRIAGVDFINGAYTFDSFDASMSTDPGKLLAMNTSYTQGNFYDATRHTVRSAVTWKPSYRARFTLETTYNRLRRQNPNDGASYFNETLIPRPRLNFSLSTDIFINTNFQMNTNRETPNDSWHLRTILSNFLFAYTMQQGHTFLVAYNAFADDEFDLKGHRSLRPASQTIVTKFSYLLNL